MRAFWAMVVANLKMTVRNRAALFWLLAFPVLFIVLFGFLFGEGDLSLSIGIVNADSSPVATQVSDAMQQVDGMDVTLGDRESELKALEDGDRQVVVVFEPQGQQGEVLAQVYYDQTNPQTSQIAVAAVRQFLSEANAQMTDTPQLIQVSVQGVETDDVTFIDFLVPGILAMSIMTNGLVGLSSAFVSYRERGILRRIKATPFSLTSFILARIVTQLLIAVVQSILLIAVAVVLFDVSISGDIVSLFGMVTIGSLAFLSLGFVISSFARNTEVADSLSNAISFPMMFLGGVFFPVDSAPSWLQPVIKIIPLTYFASGLREIMIQGATLMAVWSDVLVLLATAIIGLLLAVRFFRWEAQAV